MQHEQLFDFCIIKSCMNAFDRFVIDLFEQQYGATVAYPQEKMLRLWVGWKPFIFLYGPDEAEVLLSSTKHLNKADEYKFLHPWMGLGLLTRFAND